MTTFSELGLAQTLLRNLETQGYTTATPIQAQGIPAVLSGRDVLAAAQTGTGKTAAFSLPLLQTLGQNLGQKHPRALILCPTRELAAQIGDALKDYGQGIGLKHLVIFGGVGINPQISALKRGTDIIVATPGRLLDLQSQGAISLKGINHLVLDEADRMLDMGFIHDIKRILKLLPSTRQNLLFSATFNPDIEKLAQRLLNNPLSINVAPRNATAKAVTQHQMPTTKGDKRRMLSALIRGENWEQTLVFTRTKHGANRLCKQLQSDGLTAAAIHGNKSQTARTQALAGFKQNQIRVLVATDIAARGIDIDELPHVVNFELPHVAEDYVHRIGRTGRAGAQGSAVSLVDREEVKLLRGIERLIGRKVPELAPSEAVLEALRNAPEPVAEPERAERPPNQNRKPAQGRKKPGSGQRAANAGPRPAGGTDAPRRRRRRRPTGGNQQQR